MITKLATLNDALEIEKLLIEYKQESTYEKLTYSPIHTINRIISWITHDTVILAYCDDLLAGFCVMGIGNTFYKEKEADIEMFYVGANYRSTGISRLLVNESCRIAEEHDCAIIYTAGLSGMDKKNQMLYLNLWRKKGFTELGTIMKRSK